jgi:hypothetical protein
MRKMSEVKMEEFFSKDLESLMWESRSPGSWKSTIIPIIPSEIDRIQQLEEKVKELEKKVRDLDWVKKAVDAGKEP